MKIVYSFELHLDLGRVVATAGKTYVEAVKESIDEFAAELHGFIEKHPLIEGARVESREEEAS